MNSSHNLNIVILNHHANSPDVGGGGRHYELGKHLSENGHNVTILASSYDHWKKRYYYSEGTTVKQYSERFRFIYLKTNPTYRGIILRFANYFDYMLKASKFNEFSGKPDVIIASSVHPLAWIAGYKLSQKYKAKFIVEVRDLWPLSLYEDLKGLRKKVIFNFFELLERKYYRLADKIVTTAPFAYEYMEEKYGIDRGKVSYIPHGIDVDKFDEDLANCNRMLEPQLQDALDKYFCVTYTGALSKSEDLESLVEAASYLKDTKDIKVVIVGNGEEREKLELIIENKALDNVLIFGGQARDLVPIILSKSNILYTGLIEREAFKYGISKNKFYDYMASRKPIIFASNVRGSLINEANAGITIKPHDSFKLSESILYLYNNIDTVGKNYADSGRAYVERYHTIQEISEKFLRVMED